MPNLGVFNETSVGPSVNTLLPESSVEGISGFARTNVIFKIVIDGTDIADVGLQNLVQRITIRENMSRENELEIRISNMGEKLQSHYLLKQGNEIEVYLGWSGNQTGIVSHGKFILDSPQIKYPENTGPAILLLGTNKAATLMASGHKRRSFKNKSDSEIAEIIADEYGLGTDIKDTETTLDMIVQANETDFDFLKNRAMLYGYVMYVEWDWSQSKFILHYHPVKFKDSGKRISYKKQSGNDVTFYKTTLTTDTFLRALEVHKDQINWDSLDIYREKSEEDQDELYKQSAASGTGTYKTAKEIVGIVPQAMWFLVGEGHLQSVEELKTQTEAFSKSSRWVATILGESIGLEMIRAGHVLRVSDFESYDGPYLVRSCVHKVDFLTKGSAYTTAVELQRTFNKDIVKSGNLLSGQSSESSEKFKVNIPSDDNSLVQVG